MHIELSKAIKNADIVLIGIGNEWKYDFSKMKTNKEYMQIIDHCRNGYEWLVPYIQYYYMFVLQHCLSSVLSFFHY